MNEKHLNQILENYIAKFDSITDEEQHGSDLWEVAEGFHDLMDAALDAPDDTFAEKLNAVRTASKGLIDDSTMPFLGLVKCSEKNPGAVRSLLKNLLAPGDEDPAVQRSRMDEFFEKYEDLADRFAPGYRYQADVHALTGLMFLYAPDSHYLFRGTIAKAFAACIDFTEDWGNGKRVLLDVYYQMCNWVKEKIAANAELIEKNQTRFDKAECSLHPDVNKHILVWDLMYCARAFNLYDGIIFKKLKVKDRQVLAEKEQKAKEMQESVLRAAQKRDNAYEAMALLAQVCAVGAGLIHKTLGPCTVEKYDAGKVTLKFEKDGASKVLVAANTFVSGILRLPDEEKNAEVCALAPYAVKRKELIAAAESMERQLEPFKEFLE